MMSGVGAFSYRILLDAGSFSSTDPVVTRLAQDQITVETSSLGSGWFFIPPRLWGIRLTTMSIPPVSHYDRWRMEWIQYLQSHTVHVLLWEGWNRLGKAKKNRGLRLMRELLVGETHFSGMIPTRDGSDTVLCLKSLIKREQGDDPPPAAGRIKNRSPFLADAQREFIEGLLHCGANKADVLLRAFETPQGVLDAFQGDPDALLALEGFGEKFLAMNRRLLMEPVIFDE